MRTSRSVSALLGLLLAATAVLFGTSEAHAAGGNYVALGDSYSSGTGAGSYDSASPSCKRSSKSYPVLWKNANAPATFNFTACSGAITTDVINNQLGPVNSSTTLVSISIGGNDAGFADAMTTCILQGTSGCVTRINTAKTYIANTLPARLDAVYNAIRAKAPSAKVVVMGYPRFYQLNGSCIVGLSETSRAAINSASDALSNVISARAAAHGFTYGDVRGTFTGHEICSGSSWLHSLEIFNIGESYHPTAAGYSGGYYPVLESKA
ncbi:Lipase 1 [Streptomyces sp. RB5]|uniref:triacylglycerol lipase n=1 Tax=Streptomyces smaragdinus TaxID=2585196 RepID=A0A7K0CAL5_9ACTN|nr:SGNH/GDSL hydrolase family protein [Streptomyces smaragdinus]MQY10433.1 Lipase 1 [Streptomyces smaragdinus]